MAFFENVGKKITQASQSAVQKTKDMTEVARLNGQISDEEKKMNNCCFQIGKLYVSLYRDNPGEEFARLIEAFCQSEQKIQACRRQIQDIKGVIRCAKCGAEVANNSAFCNACGAPVAKQEKPVVQPANGNKCGTCGAVLDPAMRFCTSCGMPVQSAAPSATPAAPVAPVATPANKCSSCGATVDEGMSFCINCGAPVGNQ